MKPERLIACLLTGAALGLGLVCAYVGLTQNQPALAGVAGLLLVAGAYVYRTP